MMLTEIINADRELLADLFDLPSDSRAALIAGEYDGKTNIIEKLATIARFRLQSKGPE